MVALDFWRGRPARFTDWELEFDRVLDRALRPQRQISLR